MIKDLSINASTLMTAALNNPLIQPHGNPDIETL